MTVGRSIPRAGPGPAPAATPGRWAAPAIGLLAIVAFARTLGYGLVWDDPKLLEVLRARQLDGGLLAVIGSEFRLDVELPLGYYRPVAMFSLWLDHALGGGAAWAFHLSSVLLHAVASALVLRLLGALGAAPWPAFAAAALFAVHPVHVESVAFVSARTDVLAAIFVLVAVLLWCRDRGAGDARPAWPRLLGMGSFALACLSKEVALALPFVLGAWDALLPPASSAWPRKGRWWWLGGLAGVAVAVLVLRSAVAGVPLPGTASGAAAPLVERAREALSNLALALRLLVLPWPLSPYYTPDQLQPGMVTLAASIGTIVAWALTAGRRWCRAGLLSASWVVLFLLPAAGLVAHPGSPFAERFVYLPSIGLAVLVLAATALPMRAQRAVVAGVVLAALAGLFLTLQQSRIWRDEESLYAALMEAAPRHADGFLGLAHVRERQGRLDEAEALLRQAVAIEPSLERAHMKLGVVYGRQERWEDAIASFQRALALRPDYPDALANLGYTFLLMRRPGDAIPPLERAVAVKPQFAAAWTSLGRAYGSAGDAARAGRAFERAIALAPGDVDARLGLVFIRLRERRPDLAWAEQRALAAIDPAAGERASRAIRDAGF
ncbi:MAG: tetratricopeptide repeat protein [Acidobacteria bacterium]|jgi:tetratricopeptide (TPR) repeat protein|nr:tetratricopeptide repeat protein [Acidobacteriota bacterium]